MMYVNSMVVGCMSFFEVLDFLKIKEFINQVEVFVKAKYFDVIIHLACYE